MSVEKEIRKILGEATPAATRAKQDLVRSGLGHDKNAAATMAALKDPEAAMQNPAKRELLLKVMQDLLDVVVNDPSMVMKTKSALRKEEIELEESTLVTKNGPRAIRPGTTNTHTVIKKYKHESGETAHVVKQPNGFHGVIVTDKEHKHIIGSTQRNHSEKEAHAIAQHYAKNKTIGMKSGVWHHGSNETLVKEEVELEEALVGGQKKLDKNKNGKLDAEDFKKLRNENLGQGEYDDPISRMRKKENEEKRKKQSMKEDGCEMDDEDEKKSKKGMKENYVSHAQRKAVWASRNDAKEAMKRKMKKEEIQIDEMNDYDVHVTHTDKDGKKTSMLHHLTGVKHRNAAGYIAIDRHRNMLKKKGVEPHAFSAHIVESVTTNYDMIKGQSKNKAPTQKLATDYKLATKKTQKESFDIDEDRFSTKPPRKGTLAWEIQQRRKQQDKDPAEIARINKIGNKDHMVGTAKVIHKEETQANEAYNDYFARRKREEDIISGKKPARKKAPAQTSDYQKRRNKEKANEEAQVDEAIKLNSKVVMHAPGRDYHGQVGHVGEIRHGLHNKAPKTYTIDYGNRQSIQLQKKNIKLYKEETQIDEMMSPAETYKKLAVKHLRDSMDKNATQKQRDYAKMMNKRALEASKMDNHTDALNHYRGMAKEEFQIDEAFPTVADARKRAKEAMKSKFEKKKISTGTVYQKKHKDKEKEEKDEKGEMDEAVKADKNVPFDPPYSKKQIAIPGKQGIGPSTARHLARLALAKQLKNKNNK